MVPPSDAKTNIKKIFDENLVFFVNRLVLFPFIFGFNRSLSKYRIKNCVLETIFSAVILSKVLNRATQK